MVRLSSEASAAFDARFSCSSFVFAEFICLFHHYVLCYFSFIALLLIYRKTQPDTIDRYHVMLGMKINIVAAAVLFLVSALMIFLGGFDSPWTWVYVISYFTIVHTIFIVFALWALVRAWSGDRLWSI